FSRTQTETSWPVSAASCFSLIAAARPAGPAPTMTTSYSMASRWASSTVSILPIFRPVIVAGGMGASHALGRQEHRVCGMKAAEAAAMIEWLVEMGADEIVGDLPVTRLAATMRAPEAEARKPAPAPLLQPRALAGEFRGTPAALAQGSSDAAQM